MIFSDVPDPRLVTIRRGGTLTDVDHHLLAVWAADCAEHVLHCFEQARPGDERPRRAIELARAWARGEITMTPARTAAGHANGAARDLLGAARKQHMPPARLARRRQPVPIGLLLSVPGIFFEVGLPVLAVFERLSGRGLRCTRLDRSDSEACFTPCHAVARRKPAQQAKPRYRRA